MLIDNFQKVRSIDVLTLIANAQQILTDITETLDCKDLDCSVKQACLREFISVLRANSKAKLNTIYDILKDFEETESCTNDAIESQAILQIMIDQLESLNYENKWTSAVQSKAECLTHFAKQSFREEQTELFEKAKNILSTEELRIIGDQFTEEIKNAQKRPRHITYS